MNNATIGKRALRAIRTVDDYGFRYNGRSYTTTLAGMEELGRITREHSTGDGIIETAVFDAWLDEHGREIEEEHMQEIEAGRRDPETAPLGPLAERVRERLLNGGTWLSPEERAILAAVHVMEAGRVNIAPRRRELVERALNNVGATQTTKAVVTPELVGAVIDLASDQYMDVDGPHAAIEQCVDELAAVLAIVAADVHSSDCIDMRTSSPPAWMAS